MTLITEDWKKQAAAQMADPSQQPQEDVEKTFLDVAYQQLNNKATPLMKPQYRVGFEIVFKNDENTRLVGVFIFRVSDQYFYAPVFFINGTIKGTDLLYRANVKRFVPLTNDWCEYLIGLSSQDEGHGISIRERQLTRDQMNLLDVVEPPQTMRYRRKMAATDDQLAALDAQAVIVEKDTKEMLAKMASIPEIKDSILRKFITEFGGFNAIKKIANTAKHDRMFAQALMLGSHPDNYMPVLPAKPPGVKVASGPAKLMILHSAILKNPNVKKASMEDICNGYQIEDFRKSGQVSDVVYTDNSQVVETVETPGQYDVLMADGTTRTMLVGLYLHMHFNSGADGCSPCAVGDPHGLEDRRRPLVLVDLDNRASVSLSAYNWENHGDKQVYGTFVKKLTESDVLKEMSSAAVGKAYRIYDTEAQAFSQPFYVVSKGKSEAGFDELQISTYTASPEGSNGSKILINPDYRDYDPKDNIFGTCCKLVEVKFEKSKNDYLNFQEIQGLGSKHTLNAFIFESNFKKASIVKRQVGGNSSFLLKTARSNYQWTEELSKLAATTRLMMDCAIKQATAEEALKNAEVTGKYNFLYEDLNTKQAYNLRFNDWPEFWQRQNNEFNVLEEPRSEWAVESQEDRPIIMPHRVGDVWSQDSSETLDTLNPMQLYDLSKQRGIGSLFEHGIVGELVKTYDATALVQNYMPDLETALDRIGRIIFLYYWKPEDFAASYGSDDQSGLENKLLSNFKALGEMTIELLQKAKSQQEGGSASLT